MQRSSTYLYVTIIALIALFTASTAAAAWLYVDRFMKEARMAHAESQIESFEHARQKALRSEPKGAANYLDYIICYYPSGTKQPTGSRLDRIVEAARASAVREVIVYLWQTTGEDLGDEAAPWIAKYGDK